MAWLNLTHIPNIADTPDVNRQYCALTQGMYAVYVNGHGHAGILFMAARHYD